MKKILLIFIVLSLLFSCSKKEQYYGTWSQYYSSPALMKISKDSISISDDGNLWNTYPLTIKNNSLTFLGHTFQTSISKDSLVLENSSYVKDTITTILEIKLTKLTKYSFQEPNPEGELIYIQYGRVPNSNEYKLQLNDKYAGFEEIMDYFFSGIESCSKRSLPPRIVLICDKEAKMEDLEQIFHEMIKMNAHTFYTVNHIEHKVIDNKIKQIYYSQKQRITPIYNIRYETKTDSTDVTGFDFLNDIFFRYVSNENAQYLFLIKNEFYVGKEKYSLEAFTKKISSIVLNNSQLVTLFDLDSDYKHYTIFNAVINNSYKKLYDSVSKRKYNSTYNQLNDKEKDVIMTLFPRKNIQNMSIPHFLSFEEFPTENVNFPFKNVKEQLPAAYFE